VKQQEGGNKGLPPINPVDYKEYAVQGGFNPLSGKFQAQDAGAYFTSKGIPSDRDQRMMAHYFDFETYQQQMNANKDKKNKAPKMSKKFWKERKEKKKRAKLLAEYLAD